jgi:4-alpha-glucanotransferase
MLPVGPPGWGASPYAALSAFAVSPQLIDLSELVERGWLRGEELAARPPFSSGRVNFRKSGAWRTSRLRIAAERFFASASDDDRESFSKFRAANSGWIEDDSLFQALHETHRGKGWPEWGGGLARRDPRALEAARRRFAAAIDRHCWVQWAFDRQWRRLRIEAKRRRIRIVGDIPIFVADQSSDVWARPELFELGEDGRPTVVAGVPPDYFSETGQRWGNPLYRWEAHRSDGFAWWIARFERLFQLFDVVRVDHFRGFAAHWEIPAAEATAVKGRWVPVPGEELFEAVTARLERLPLLAEDLGVITPDVETLRDRFAFPGMKVLQFAFGDDSRNPFLPHNYSSPNVVVYTGTHDNDTTRGWFRTLPSAARRRLEAQVGGAIREKTIHRTLARLALSSVADTAILPLQDALGLPASARMNRPGSKSGNWAWRVAERDLAEEPAAWLREAAETYARLPEG